MRVFASRERIFTTHVRVAARAPRARKPTPRVGARRGAGRGLELDAVHVVAEAVAQQLERAHAPAPDAGSMSAASASTAATAADARGGAAGAAAELGSARSTVARRARAARGRRPRARRERRARVQEQHEGGARDARHRGPLATTKHSRATPL